MFVNRSYRSCDAGRKLEVVSYVRHALVNSPPGSYAGSRAGLRPASALDSEMDFGQIPLRYPAI